MESKTMYYNFPASNKNDILPNTFHYKHTHLLFLFSTEQNNSGECIIAFITEVVLQKR